MNIKNPNEITDKHCPVFISSVNINNFISFLIRKRTGSINHSMIMRRPGYVVSQDSVYHEVPIEKYMKKGNILRFWVCKDITDNERGKIMSGINSDLELPWYKRAYDYPGVLLGQLTGLRFLNVPWLNYCSEKVRKRVKVLIPDIKKHPTPAELDTLYKKNERFKFLGQIVVL